MSLELLLEVFHHVNVMVSTELRAGCLLFWLQVEPLAADSTGATRKRQVIMNVNTELRASCQLFWLLVEPWLADSIEATRA